MRSNTSVYQLVAAGVLCAIGLAVPLFMPKVILGPMSFTLGSHVAIFIAMFLSPKLAAAVCLGTTLGFFLTTPLIIALRAATHLVFALVGAFILRKAPDMLDRAVPMLGFNVGIGLLHALGEVLVVTPFFISGSMFNAAQLENGYLMSVLVLVGAGTFVHSMLDYTIAVGAWRMVRGALPQVKVLQG